ncbi:MAG: hypothetical protein EA368_11150 [Leptolyngbya sp. DLM2.Bin27]|nr:MAG: hypothetical protein EA368_11150 [Leptolyngbya sp. DLM2.Bin27]
MAGVENWAALAHCQQQNAMQSQQISQPHPVTLAKKARQHPCLGAVSTPCIDNQPLDNRSDHPGVYRKAVAYDFKAEASRQKGEFMTSN